MSGSQLTIRVVANETGIPLATLRAWERRYGFPSPARGPSGGRRYSPRDVARLRLIAGAIAAGYRPGDVIRLSDVDVSRLASKAEPPHEPTRSEPAWGTRVVEEIIAALRRDDVPASRALLRRASIAFDPRSFLVHVAHPLAVRMGETWACGELEVHQEHLGTSLLTTHLRMILAAHEEERPPIVVLATLPGEAHVLGLEIIAAYLAVRGASPRLLGPETPVSAIVAAAKSMRASIIGVSLTERQDTTVTTHLRRLAGAMPPRMSLWIGGAGATTVKASRARRVGTFAEVDEALRGG